VRIRRTTGPGASPLPGRSKNRNEQARRRSRRIRASVAGQSVCERHAGALPLIFVVSITVVTCGGDR
jgi:hypothetical protein